MVRPFSKALPKEIAQRGRHTGKTSILTMTLEKENESSECLGETLTNRKFNSNSDTCNDGKRFKGMLKETLSNLVKNDVIKKQKMNNIKKRVFKKSDIQEKNIPIKM